MDNTSDSLASFASQLDYDKIPIIVRERAKVLILDMIGVALRSRYDAESTSSLLEAAKHLGYCGGNCSVIGDLDRYTPPGAAFINGTLAHSLDFDDTHAAGSIHPSAPIVPAVFAAAEMVGASGRDVIAAIIAGYETQIRLSLALGPAEHYKRGFHPTATCGIFGAAAAAGCVLKMTSKQIVSAFGIALSQSAGSMQFLHEGGWTKRSHVGQASMNGLIAAIMAREGFRGAIDPMEGKAGFLSIYSPNSDLTKAIKGLGEHWETMSIAIKPYPSCRYSHAPLDGIRKLMIDQNISANEVLNVSIGVSQTAWDIIGGPVEQKQNPRSIVDGQFSMPFCAAVVIREGNMVWDNYSSHINDVATLALCKKIETKIGEKAEAEFPRNMAGSVKMTTARGEFETYVKVPKGEPENFVTELELRTKFDGLVKPYLGKTPTAMFADSILMMEQEQSITKVLNQSHPSQPLVMAGE